MMLAITHQNVIRYFTTCMYEREVEEEMKREYCIVMELASGGTLAQRIMEQTSAGKPFAAEVITRIGVQLCSALHHMHRDCKFIHRDLKPQNILLDARGNVKICDLGLATVVNNTAASASLSKKGTTEYMSPEKGNRRRYGEKDDMWAVGCILVELVRLVVTSSYSSAGLWAVPNKVPEIVAAVASEHGGRFAEATRQLLAVDPRQDPRHRREFR